MSMLSAQVDELRELATRYDELQVGAVKAVTMPSDMGSILRDAADTIWQLRDDLQRANAENAKLQEEIEATKHDLQVFSIRSVQLDADNAKLRELVLGLKWCSENYGCEDACPLYDKSEPDHCRDERLLRELGMEVN